MPKLNQVIAIAAGKKSQCEKAITEVYHKLQKPALLTGIARTYRPKDDDGDKLPSESKAIQYRAKDGLKEAAEVMSDLFDVIATQEYANCVAGSDVVVDGQIVLKNVPVTYLLFLEKQLLNINSLVDKLPTLDPGETWSYNQATDSFSTNPAETTRTKKVLRNHVKAEATDKFPAQVDTYHEDVLVGYWTTIVYSGAITEKDKTDMLGRVRKLQEAVKVAREQANMVEANRQMVGKSVFDYLLGE